MSLEPFRPKLGLNSVSSYITRELKEEQNKFVKRLIVTFEAQM